MKKNVSVSSGTSKVLTPKDPLIEVEFNVKAELPKSLWDKVTKRYDDASIANIVAQSGMMALLRDFYGID